MKRIWLVFTIVWIVLVSSTVSFGAEGDAKIQYQSGLDAKENENAEEAAKLFKKACMAEDGFAEPCLEWAALANAQENAKDVKRALSSAVMLSPENIEARYALAVLLLKKKDYVWAIEHLEAGLDAATDEGNKSLLRYYLGYAQFKNKQLEVAKMQLKLARSGLSRDMRQKCDYYLGLIAERDQDNEGWAEMMLKTGEGPDKTFAGAAENRLSLQSAFPRQNGLAGQAILTIGVNTHPASAFLDDVETDSPPVLQSIFRADGIYTRGGYTRGFRASLTAYREQNWTELGSADVATDPTEEAAATESDEYVFKPGDFNVTLLLPQVAYLNRKWRGNKERELLFGLDGETQFLDNVPKKNSEDDYEGSGFGMNAFAVAGKVWWSIARDRDTIYGVRAKIELRPNYIDENRSSTRYRLRLLGTKHTLGRALRLKAMVGARYDRTYANPAVFKYDRFVPELELNARWRTPVPRLTAVAGAKLKYNWYMNAKGNENNTFRPPYVDVEGVSDELNAAYKEGYYDVERQDFEWELSCEVHVALWKRALVALTFKHHQRASNLDGAPTPIWDNSQTGETERMEAQNYGYVQDVVMLELRQGF